MVPTPTDDAAPDPQTVKVGVLLTLEPDQLGGELADASALDAAGADALWVDCGPTPELDVLALTAALAVVTFRSCLVVTLPDDTHAPDVARSLVTIRRLSHDRLRLVTEGDRHDEMAGRNPGVGLFRRLPGEQAVFEGSARSGGTERWVSVPYPGGREAWRAARADAVANGVHGLVVPRDPSLLDILRNPDEPRPRSDLNLAQG